jgi:3-hydroxymyristoyl/3-hydroxydecanoyl-(acyl carrier protein) dehydratase
MRFLFVDRILQLSPGKMVKGMKQVTSQDPYLCRDEGGRLCFIPSLIGEALGQLAAWNVMVSNDFTHRPVAGVVSSAKLFRSAYVGEILLLESFIDALDETAVQYHSVARVADEVVFSIDGALGPLLPMSDFIERGEVCRQFAHIDQPGDWPPVAAFTHSAVVEGSPLTVPMVFDNILASEPGIGLCAEKRIHATAPYFPDHFPRKPVLPLTVLLECQLNLAREFLAQSGFSQSYQVSELRKIKMNGFVHPGDVVVCHLRVKHHDEKMLILNYRTEVDGKRVCVVELVMTAGVGA